MSFAALHQGGTHTLLGRCILSCRWQVSWPEKIIRGHSGHSQGTELPELFEFFLLLALQYQLVFTPILFFGSVVSGTLSLTVSKHRWVRLGGSHTK